MHLNHRHCHQGLDRFSGHFLFIHFAKRPRTSSRQGQICGARITPPFGCGVISTTHIDDSQLESRPSLTSRQGVFQTSIMLTLHCIIIAPTCVYSSRPPPGPEHEGNCLVDVSVLPPGTSRQGGGAQRLVRGSSSFLSEGGDGVGTICRRLDQ